MLEADYMDGSGIARCSDYEPNVDREPDNETESSIEDDMIRLHAHWVEWGTASVTYVWESAADYARSLRQVCRYNLYGLRFRDDVTDEQLIAAADDLYRWRMELERRRERTRRMRA
jgi:hypothetical protein